jgi:hypothetical protein
MAELEFHHGGRRKGSPMMRSRSAGRREREGRTAKRI